MSQSLYHALKNIGIDEELAAKVSASLDPEYNASKKDILVMQEAMMQVQLCTDARYHELNGKLDRSLSEMNSKLDHSLNEINSRSERRYHELNNKLESSYHELSSKIDKVDSNLRVEVAAISRQFWITFGGLITTILSVFTVNWYFH